MLIDLVPSNIMKKMEDLRKSARPWNPLKPQKLGLRGMLEHNLYGLLLDPGTGKSSTTLAAVKMLRSKKMVKRTLLVAPLRPLYEVWPEQVSEWKDFNDLHIAILHGANKESNLRRLTPKHAIVLINPEGLAWLTSSAARMRQLNADCLVIDESSKFKNSQSQRFKALKPYLALFKRRYILTGSPRPRNYEDLFAQIYLLDRGHALGQYLTHFRNRFFFPTGYQMKEWALLPGKEDEINRLVSPMLLRLDAKDYLKLPTTPERVHKVELPSKARKMYDEVEETLINFTLFDAPLTSAAAARSKCAQMANGSVYTDGPKADHLPASKRPVAVVHTAKVDALVELYEELQGEPLLLSIGYHHDVEAIRQALGKDIPCINSKSTNRQVTAIINDWNAGKLPLLMGHPASMGHGLNLQKSNGRHVGFFDIPDDYDLYDQFWRRVARQGNKSHFVFLHMFVAQDTVDVPKMRNLHKKGVGQNAFLKAMKEYAEERMKLNQTKRLRKGV